MKDVIDQDNGQAIFEFIIFLPFLLMLLSVIITISAAVNGSINQQKITRAYFFHRLKGNSTAPGPQEMTAFPSTMVSMRYVGWAEKMDGSGSSGSPYTTCYKMTKMLGIGGTSECDAQMGDDDISSIVKPRTVFGICTGTYQRVGDQFVSKIEEPGCGYF